ncbi:hypothetical protein ABVK25_012512 [Lepraria finkii]|uniref:Uncharacterized protein n=1 Tax=Lepraria finkii TaxID=1340010 RepID=A0ABR4AE07_9LECA
MRCMHQAKGKREAAGNISTENGTRPPRDTPHKENRNVAVSNGRRKLHEVTVDTPLDEVFQNWKEDGAVVIKGLLTTSQANDAVSGLASVLDRVQQGAFHGRKTKRAGDVINNSATFRDHVLENDFVHAICKRCYSEGGHNGDYWLAAATTLNASGPQPAQVLHRDLTSYPPYAQLGSEGTEAQINFLVAMSDFTDVNGATRLIPGSNKWTFDQHGSMEQTIPAEMNAGDCLLIGSKVIYGIGENKTTSERKCTRLSVCASFLTPAEAHLFIVSLETAKKLSKHTQRFLGFRSQYPRGSSGLWTKDYVDLALHLGLDDLSGAMEDLREVIEQPRE